MSKDPGMTNKSTDTQETVEIESLAVENSEKQDVDIDEKPLTFMEVLGSTFSAAVGVQSKARRTRDFSRGKPLHFVLAGLIFALTFIVVVVGVVRLVLSQVS